MKAASIALTTLLTMSFVVATLVQPGSAMAEIPWQTNLRAAHGQAQAEGKLLLLHFYSDNCAWCDRLEEGAFQDASVGQAITSEFVPVKIHANTSPKLAEMFKVTKFPSDVIVTTEGKTLAHGVSPQDPKRYVSMLAATIPTPTTTGPTKTNPMATSTEAQLASNRSPVPQTGTPQTDGVPSYAASPAPPTGKLPGQAKTAPQPQSQGGFELPLTPPPAAVARSVGNGAPTAAPETVAAPETTAAPETAAAETTAAKTSPQSVPAKTVSATTPVATPELAMDGYCAVTVVDEAKWVEGSPEFGVIHLGKLYLFASESKMQQFLSTPIPYTPVLNEIDVVRFFEERVIVPGKREWAMQDPFNKRMFFFADEAAMLHFENTYERYVSAAIEVMDKAVQDSNPR